MAAIVVNHALRIEVQHPVLPLTDDLSLMPVSCPWLQVVRVVADLKVRSSNVCAQLSRIQQHWI